MTSAEKTEQFNLTWKNIESVYENYAKSVGMTYTSMYIFNLIAITNDCTQSLLCEKTLLPKQTVNVAVTQFFKQGLIELREVLEDRRNKTIHLTKKGKNFSKKYVNHIMNCERKAMDSMTKEQSEQLIQSMKKYEEVFRNELLSIKK